MEIIADNIVNVGVEDRIIDLFEGMYKVPDGVTYNSYLVKDQKIAIVDSVDSHFTDEWLNNLENALCGKTPDYLIIQHMEPDHSGSVKAFAEKYPNCTIVGNSKTFVMLGEYFGQGFPENRLTVTDGQELSLGDKIFKFIFAPMVHWPEVMFTYESTTKTLFSADAFGKFGITKDNDWSKEARRYYIGIVGKYGVQVASVLKKLSAYQIEHIAPLHGYPLKGEELVNAINLYVKWSSYQPEIDNGVFIAYCSVYGHTKDAVLLLEKELASKGVNVQSADLSREDWAECVAKAFQYPKIVIASPTYNASIFPSAREFIDRLVERGFKNRTVGFIENGTWAPVSAKLMREKLEGCKDLKFTESGVKIRSALNEESRMQVCALAEELAGGNS
ncbi:MAG: FprA family A-type flavoprotein [Candidatus Coproplasma sp.]